MAEESHYSSDNKRKYEESETPSSRRATGFSAPTSAQSPIGGSFGGQHPASYNSGPLLSDDILLAKKKAQEIAARLLSNAEAIKKPRVENGGGGGGGFDSDEGYYQKTFVPQAASSYGYSSSSKKIEVPNGRVGAIIGKGGETIKYLQMQSGAKIQITRDMDADPYSATRSVDLMGSPDQISKAEQLIQDVLAEATSGGLVSRGFSGEQTGSDTFAMKVASNKVGLVIGKGGETIKNMQASTGARIQVIPLHLPPGDPSTERTVQIHGTSEQIEAAKQLVNEVTAENRMRNQGMSGGYSQQGYQARPATSWAPPPQQPGYGYLQPGQYPGSAPPQYSMNQPQYPGYPPQPTHGGYQVQGGGYDYYGQQQQQQQPAAGGGGGGSSADNSSYSAYSQQTGSGYNQGQGYSHDGYGGGYVQPQLNRGSGYDQQQGYDSTPGYANASNPTPDGQPSPKPTSYPQQAGYGTQAHGGYSQQGQLAYGQSQSGYAPPSESSAGQHPSSTGYGPSYGGPSYGAAPQAQPNYGQSQASQYGVNYTGGYSQPQGYSGDGGNDGVGGTNDSTARPSPPS